MKLEHYEHLSRPLTLHFRKEHSFSGMKAVVWTDTFQSFLMIGGQIALVIIGSVKVGGMDEVWKINDNWGRLDVKLNPDPTIRLTLWSAIIGGTFLSMGIH